MSPSQRAVVVQSTDADAVSLCCETLLRHELAAFPTETVYGLAGLSTSAEAIERIYIAKRRPRHNPLISHMADLAMAEHYVQLDQRALQLAETFWPGPLTLVLPMRAGGIDRSSTGGFEMAAVRVPDGFAHDVIAQLDQPVAAPSANLSGKISPTSAEHVLASLGDRIPLIVDGGPTRLGVESTVLLPGPSGVHVLRPGVLTAERIAAATGIEVLQARRSDQKHSPGTMTSHYAPRAQLRLNVQTILEGEVAIGFGTHEIPGTKHAAAVLNLSATGDLDEAAKNLFQILHHADAQGTASIAVAPIPETGTGIAINDRLRRAAVPRPAQI